MKLLEGYNKKEIESFSKKFAKYIFLRFKNHSVYAEFLKKKKLNTKYTLLRLAQIFIVSLLLNCLVLN